MADEVSRDMEIGHEGKLLRGFLNAILSDVGQSGFDRLADSVEGHSFAHSDQANRFGFPSERNDASPIRSRRRL